MGRPQTPVVERFWRMVTKTDGCWTVPGTRYGKIKTGPPEKRTVSTHKFSWELHFGPVKAGMLVCHKCNNKRCVRPDHLYLGTCKQNITDAIKDGLKKSWSGDQNPKWIDGRRCYMPRPKQGYVLKNGTKVPGVTTIVGRFKDSGALIYWAWQCGKDGKDIREEKTKAADAGSCCHEMIDCHLHNRTFRSAEWESITIGKAEHAFLAYLDWVEQNKLSVEASEVALVSEKYYYGGCFDAVMRGGHLRLLDYKTSSGLYADMLVQVAGGYSILWEEHYPHKPLQGIDLLRISKPKQPDDPISFEHRHWSAEIFPIAQEQFLCFRTAYELDKRLKGFM